MAVRFAGECDPQDAGPDTLGGCPLDDVVRRDVDGDLRHAYARVRVDDDGVDAVADEGGEDLLSPSLLDFHVEGGCIIGVDVSRLEVGTQDACLRLVAVLRRLCARSSWAPLVSIGSESRVWCVALEAGGGTER